MKDEVKQKKILKDTLDVYEIPEQFVFAWRYDEQPDTIIIVTNGGKKIVHKVGAPIDRKLTMLEISGIPSQEKTFWSPKLNQRIKLSELEEVENKGGK